MVVILEKLFSVKNCPMVKEDPENPVYLSEKRFLLHFLFLSYVSVNLSKKKQF